MALAVPLSRFTSRIGGGSAFFVRPHFTHYMEPLGLSWVFDRLKEIVVGWRAGRQRRSQQRVEALASFLRALNETEIYFGTSRVLGRDRQREEELSRFWTETGHRFRHIDAGLAGRCETKGCYWADPVGWSAEELLQARVGITEMRSTLHDLLDSEPTI